MIILDIINFDISLIFQKYINHLLLYFFLNTKIQKHENLTKLIIKV